MYQITSDAFFKDVDAISSLGGSPDIAFLDGMHLFEFLLRDFYNTESICDPSSVMILHDCLPLNEAMAHRDSDALRARRCAVCDGGVSVGEHREAGGRRELDAGAHCRKLASLPHNGLPLYLAL